VNSRGNTPTTSATDQVLCPRTGPYRVCFPAHDNPAGPQRRAMMTAEMMTMIPVIMAMFPSLADTEALKVSCQTITISMLAWLLLYSLIRRWHQIRY